MMPSLYSNAVRQQVPPTPPDFYDFPRSSTHDQRQLPAIHPSRYNTQITNYGLKGSELGEPGHKPQRYSTATTLNLAFSQDSRMHESSGYTATNRGPPNTYKVLNAPLLPPIRVQEKHGDESQQFVGSKSATTLTQTKEEKVTGGVAAHLDYEMEDMVDFVSEITQGIYDICGSHICLADIDIPRSVVDSKTTVHPDFRKFVSQVLSSTRLPSSTVLLGLHYLAIRMTSLSVDRELRYDSGSVRIMLTTALLLGSKFLDDNTFQNRSWSEVSNIPVHDINVLEIDWLMAICWNMHVDPSDSDGYLQWHRQWQRYQVNKANRIEPLVQSLRDTHLDENSVQRRSSFQQLPSPLNNIAPSSVVPQFDQWPLIRSPVDYSPPSAPETGPNTPQWYDPHNGYGFGLAPHQTYQSFKLPAPLQITGINPLRSDYHLSYNQQSNSSAHNSHCPCGFCLSHYERSFRVPGSALQPAIG